MPNMVIKFVKSNGDVLYVGEAYDWRLLKNGLTDFSSFEADVTVTQDYARDGGETNNIRLADKDRTIKLCNVNWRNNSVNRANIQRFFTYNTDYKIYVTHEGVTRWIEGILYRMAMNEPTNEDYLLKITASFHFDSPYFKSMDDFGEDVAAHIPKFAFPWMSAIGIGTAVGVFNFTRSITITNNGDNVAYPRIIIRFKDSVLNPVVSINNGFIRILGTFGVNDNILIDYTVNPPRITNNDINILGMCDRTSDFDSMYIMIGKNTFSFDAENGSDEMSVSVYYNQLYTMI